MTCPVLKPACGSVREARSERCCHPCGGRPCRRPWGEGEGVSKRPRRGGPMPKDRPNILVVDDLKKDQEMLAAPFRGQYDVCFAANLEEAGQVLENWWPDIALVDAMFPPRRGAAPGFQVGPFLDLVDKGAPAYLRTPQI